MWGSTSHTVPLSQRYFDASNENNKGPGSKVAYRAPPPHDPTQVPKAAPKPVYKAPPRSSADPNRPTKPRPWKKPPKGNLEVGVGPEWDDPGSAGPLSVPCSVPSPVKKGASGDPAPATPGSGAMPAPSPAQNTGTKEYNRVREEASRRIREACDRAGQ